MQRLTARASLGFARQTFLNFACQTFLLLGPPCFAAHAARAQDLDDASFAGRVADANGASVVSARVTLTLKATGAARVSVTDSDGRYRFVDLAPGEYAARVSAAGFADESRADLSAAAGQTLRLDFVLRPAGVAAEQTVTAEATAAAVDTSRTVTGGALSRAEIERLPLSSGSPLDLVFTLPGVTEEPLSTRGAAEDADANSRTPARRAQTPEEAGAFALAGGPAYSNNVTIDGLDNNDDRAARERFQPPAEAVEEVQVITNQFSAEYGRASGGRVNLRTRSGSRRLRGRASHFFRDESLDANTFFNNQRGLPRLPFQRHTFGLTLGGPLTLPRPRKNDPTTSRTTQGTNSLTTDPTSLTTEPTTEPTRPATAAASSLTSDQTSSLTSDQTGSQPGGATASPAGDVSGSPARPRTFFFLSYEFDTTLDTTLIDTLVPVLQNPRFPLPQPTALAGRRREAGAGDAPAELAPYVSTVPTPRRSHALLARLDHNFSAAHDAALLLQSARSRDLRQFGGGSRLADALQGRTRDSDALAYTDNLVLSPRAVNQLRAQFSRLAPALKSSGPPARPVVLIDIDDPLPAGDAAGRSGTLVAGAANAGASDRRESRWQIQDALTFVGGAHTLKVGFDLQRVRSVFTDLADASGTYDFASAADFLSNAPARFRRRFHTESAQRNFYSGIFFQDEWRARPNLVLSFGLRREHESIIRDRDNFAPRAAIAYDPFGTGLTVVRLGAGIFYNRVLLRTVDDFTLGRQRLFFDTNSLTDPLTGRALTESQRRAFVAANLRFPETPDADSPLVRQFGSLQADFARRLDPNLRIPESYQFNAGFERELSRGLVFEANYTFSRGLHLWREFNANAPRLPAPYADFAAYLLSRDFPNFRDAAGARPLYDAQTAGDLVRFTLAPASATNDAAGRLFESGVAVSVFNLNSVNSSAALSAALAALADLRPDPSRTQVEQLVSAGNSFYHGLTLEARQRLRARGIHLSFRAAYALSRLTDDGVVNTSSALVPGDFRRERAPSLLDRRHRFNVSGTLDLPRRALGLKLAAVLRLASAAPFNLTLGGADRNLDDVSNDRPSFDGDLRRIRWRRPGTPADPSLLDAFSLPAIGRPGDLPRNAGRGPRLFALDLSLTRDFTLSNRARLRPVIEIDNLLNATVFTFGAEFIDFRALRPDASPAERRAALDSFLTPARTLRPRTVRAGLRLDF